jgi:hypothetical protein
LIAALHEVDVAALLVAIANDRIDDVTHRRDVAFSQACTCLVTSFVATLVNRRKDGFFLTQLYVKCALLGVSLLRASRKCAYRLRFSICRYNIGFLVQFESLLSTQGKEMGMIEDMCVSVEDLRGVSFRLEPAPEDVEPFSRISVQGSRYRQHTPIPLAVFHPERCVCVCVGGGIVAHTETELYCIRAHDGTLARRYRVCITLEIPPPLYDRLPANVIRSGNGLIPVMPVFFTHGVNEMQTLANRLGETDLQTEIVTKGMRDLSEYCVAYKAFVRKSAEPKDADRRIATLDTMLSSLQAAVRSDKAKNVHILTMSEDIAREMNGGRLTCCKSGKDRTGMSVTLEQARILITKHGMEESKLQEALHLMRSMGTRMDNVEKNIGQRKYGPLSTPFQSCIHALQQQPAAPPPL